MFTTNADKRGTVLAAVPPMGWSLPGWEFLHEPHCTLWYLSAAESDSEGSLDEWEEMVQQVGRRHVRVNLPVTGTAIFGNEEVGFASVVTLDGSLLAPLRQDLNEMIGFRMPEQKWPVWRPHLTLKYLEPGEKPQDVAVPPTIPFGGVVIWTHEGERIVRWK